jgi:hypothetical protein
MKEYDEYWDKSSGAFVAMSRNGRDSKPAEEEEAENSGQAFEQDMDALYGVAVEEDEDEDQENQ